VLVSAGALGADATGRLQHKSTTTRTSKVIAYAKQLDVNRLDSTLPKQPLDHWMRDSGAPASATKWVLSDCDLKDPAPPAPLCVKFEVRQGRASILGLIKVGTQHDGVTGQPRFLGLGLTIGLAEYLESADNLSELPRLITRAKQPEQRIPKDHPLRAIRAFVDQVLADMSREFDRPYATTGRPSIPPERLLRAQFLQIRCSRKLFWNSM
jgi:hypothetical protein